MRVPNPVLVDKVTEAILSEWEDSAPSQSAAIAATAAVQAVIEYIKEGK